MKRRNNDLNAFVTEVLRQSHSKDEILKEFIAIQLKLAKSNLKAREEEASKNKPAAAAPVAKADTGAEAGEKEEEQKEAKPTLGVSAGPGADAEDSDKKEKPVIDNDEKFELLQRADTDFKNVAAYSRKVNDDLIRWAAKISSDEQIYFKKFLNQNVKFVQADVGKRFQKLNVAFDKYGDERDLLSRAVLMGVITKILFDLEKQSQ